MTSSSSNPTQSNPALEVDERPWGRYTVLLDCPHTKVKRIEVNPGHRLSLQKHTHRQEHWVIVKGQGEVHLNGNIIPVTAGDTVQIDQGSVHRIANLSNEPMEFIEVQLGDYFGEDDIVRLEDDYNRT